MTGSRTGHVIEPELLGPRPRRASLPRQGWLGVGCLGLFLLPFILIGIYTLAWAFHGVLLLAYGRTAPARFIERVEGDSEDQYRWKLRYRYEVDGRTYTAQDDDRCCTRTGPDVPLSVRVSPVIPGWDSKVLGPDGAFPDILKFRWFFTLFWNAITWTFLFVLGRALLQSRALYRYGEPAVAEIVKKKVEEGESKSYSLQYAFSIQSATGASVGSDTITNSERVSESEWHSVAVGDKLTVLYDPANPTRSTLYRLGSFRILPNKSP